MAEDSWKEPVGASLALWVILEAVSNMYALLGEQSGAA